MKHLNLLAGLTLTLSLAACGTQPTTPAADTSLSTADMGAEVGGAVASDVEQTLASLSDLSSLGGLSVSGQAACRTTDPASSILDAAGKPTDTDADGMPDKVTFVYAGCPRGGAVLTGSSVLSDPNADPALAGSFLDQPQNLTLAYTRADGTVRSVVRSGSSTGTLTNRTALNIVRNVSEKTSDTLHPDRQATWLNNVTVQFLAAAGSTIDRRSALPAGTVSVNGPREWHVVNGSKATDAYLTIQTTTPLAYDPSCTTTSERIFGSSHARSGAFTASVYSDAARRQLMKTVTVTYQDCAPTITVK